VGQGVFIRKLVTDQSINVMRRCPNTTLIDMKEQLISVMIIVAAFNLPGVRLVKRNPNWRKFSEAQLVPVAIVGRFHPSVSSELTVFIHG
jgi:hypothetical protein